MNAVLSFLSRVKLEILLLVSVALALFVFPLHVERQGLHLFLYKVMLFSASQAHALLARKALFPYLDFKAETDGWSKAMAIAVHVSAAYLYAEGG